MSEINAKLSSALTIVQAAKSKISVPTFSADRVMGRDFQIAQYQKELNSPFQPNDYGNDIRNPDIDIIDIRNPGGGIDPAEVDSFIDDYGLLHINNANQAPILSESNIQQDSDGSITTTTREVSASGTEIRTSETKDSDGSVIESSETVSKPDTDVANGPVSNVTTTKDADGNITVIESVTTPDGLTIEATPTPSPQAQTNHNDSGVNNSNIYTNENGVNYRVLTQEESKDYRENQNSEQTNNNNDGDGGADDNPYPGMQPDGWTDKNGVGVG